MAHTKSKVGKFYFAFTTVNYLNLDRSILTSDGGRYIASTVDVFDYANSYFYSALPDTQSGKFLSADQPASRIA